MFAYKLVCIAFGPWRQQNVVQLNAILFYAQVEIVRVQQKFGQIEEFWRQLLHIGHVVLRRTNPRILDTVEHAISQIKVAALNVFEMTIVPFSTIFILKSSRPGRYHLTCSLRNCCVNGSCRTKYDTTIMALE
jgi:hypothetical protein